MKILFLTLRNLILSQNDYILPVAQDVQMMLLVGFGFLMTFPRRFGYSAVVQTMAVVAVTVEWAVVCIGVGRMGDKREIQITWAE